VAGGATGLIRACRDASISYAKTRKTFGSPISEHQLVKRMIALMEKDYQASRLLYLNAGWLKNNGVRNTKQTALAKWFACDAAEKAASDCVQVHGAYGFSDEYPAERFYRNSKGSSIYEGSREIQTLMQADYVLGARQDKKRPVELPRADQ
jgi:glutaryl-CoA dehydrogenase (non-decarboxylating)